MLKILIDVLKPSLRTGLKEFKGIIQTANAKKFGNNVVEMLNAMESAHDEITVKHSKTYDSYMEDLFKAFKTFPNKIFTDFIIRIEDDWEADKNSGVTDTDELITKVRNKYNNMVHSETWDYVDPSDAKILALTTRLDSLTKELDEERVKSSSGRGGYSDKKQSPFDIRRTKYVGDQTVIDGVAYDWCSLGHKSRASPDGMYMPAGHDHEKWLENKKNRGYGKKSTPTGSNSAGKKMILADDMKAALMTFSGMNQEEADTFMNRLN